MRTVCSPCYGAQNDPFNLLYVSFCDLHGLPRAAVKMVLDGVELSLTDTPAANDLETGDLIDAKVDFSQRVQDNIKRYLRLRLVVFGKRAEVFKIDAVRLAWLHRCRHLECEVFADDTNARLVCGTSDPRWRSCTPTSAPSTASPTPTT